MSISESVQESLTAVETAVSESALSASAEKNIRVWLTEDRYAGYRDEVIEHIADGNWQKLDDVFWTIIPFGTGGRRGRMYPIGSNAINDRTIGESAQGLADYVVEFTGGEIESLVCHRLRHAAPIAALHRTLCRNHGGRRIQGLFVG